MMLTDEQKAQIRRLAFWAVDDQPWIPEGVAEGLLTSHAIEAATIAATRAAEEISAQMVAAERERLMELVEDLREEMFDSRHAINSNQGFFDGVKLSLRVIDKLFSAEFERREAEREGA